MSLTNPNTPVSQQDLQDFYHKILPYMGGSSGGSGGGHTIEDAEGTDLTQRDKLQFGEGLSATDDSTNEKTVVDIDPMPAEDMDEVIDELPTGGNIAVTGYVPLGTLIPFYGETAPKFFLACDGATYNKADYPELANHLLSLTNNIPYVVDGDDTKFKVPDLRGEFIRGTGTNSRTSQGSGADVGEHQNATVHNNIHGEYGNNSIGLTIDSQRITNGDNVTYNANTLKYITLNGTYTPSSAIYPDYYTARPTNTSVLFCIAYKDIYSNPMNDYSTDEKVVGTWIDGKPLYQKTFTGLHLTISSSWVVLATIPNVSKIIKADTYDDSTANQQLQNMSYTRVNGNNVEALAPSGLGHGVTMATLQYTKTIDT